MNDIKTTSCGIFVYDNNLNFLSIYPYGASGAQWNIPKGMQEKDELYYGAAIREFKEETSINIFDFVKDIKYAGKFKYNKYKDLGVFTVKTNKLYNMLPHCKCESDFELNGKFYPEISDYKILNIRNDCNIISQKLLSITDLIFKKHK